MKKIKSQLKNVPETMLWTLHNRATEAMRNDGIIKDEKCVEIYNAIDFDYEKVFGKAEPSHASRSIKFDKEIRSFLEKYPDGTIINLGEGLETQRYRIGKNKALWVSVDLPDAMAIREKFIKPTEQYLHSPVSALDRKWFDLVPKDKPVFITAQGLFMYLPEEEVRSIIKDMVETFSEGYLMFDVIPKWLSKKTMSKKGWSKTKYYITPKMPWGINRNEFMNLKKWSPSIESVSDIQVYEFPRGIVKIVHPVLLSLPILKNYLPTAIKIKFKKSNL